MTLELNFLSAVAPQGARPAKTLEGEGGEEGNFALLLEDSLVTEQTPPPTSEEGALPAAENLGITENSPPTSQDGDAADGDLFSQAGVVSMAEIVNNFGLTEKQASRLATLLGISEDDMDRVGITAKNPGKNFPALMPDGTYKNLANLLNLVENGQLLGRQEAVAKIADMLGLSKTGAAALLEELGIFSFEISGETTPPKTAITQTAQHGETAAATQGQAESSIQPSGQNSSQNANNNNSASGETATDSVDTDDGDFIKNADSDLKAMLKQATQTTAPEKTAEVNATSGGHGFRESVAPVSKTFQTFATPGGTEETNIGNQAKAVMSRIVEKASIISFPNRTQARISLSPPSLGFVNIEISTRNESASALIVVESHAVKQIIEQNIHQLKTAFEQQGIKVEEMSVNVAGEGGNSFENDARFQETQPAFSDYAAADGDAKTESPEDGALKNERIHKNTGSYYVLDIKV